MNNPKRIRELSGYSVREMACRLGVSTQRVYAIEGADDWQVSTLMSYYKACVGKGSLDTPDERALLVLAAKALTGSLERWAKSEAGSSEVVHMDFDYLVRTWALTFNRAEEAASKAEPDGEFQALMRKRVDEMCSFIDGMPGNVGDYTESTSSDGVWTVSMSVHREEKTAGEFEGEY